MTVPACLASKLSFAPPCPGGRCADFVLLNKTDMLAERQLDSLAAIVASLNPLAKVVHARARARQRRAAAHSG